MLPIFDCEVISPAGVHTPRRPRTVPRRRTGGGKGVVAGRRVRGPKKSKRDFPGAELTHTSSTMMCRPRSLPHATAERRALAEYRRPVGLWGDVMSSTRISKPAAIARLGKTETQARARAREEQSQTDGEVCRFLICSSARRCVFVRARSSID